MLFEFIIGFSITILVGISVAALANYLNRHFIKIIKKANDCVCQRLLIREPMSQELFFDSVSLSEEEELLKAKWLLKKIAMLLPGCHVELLYPDDKLKELLKVRREELRDVSETDWQKARIKENYIMVFDDDIFDTLGKLVDERLLEISKGLFYLPESEKEWYQFILEKPLIELVIFLASFVRKEYSGEWQQQASVR